MNIVKKTLCVLVSLVLAVGLWGCDRLTGTPQQESSSAAPAVQNATPAPEKPFEIGLLQFEDSPALDEVRESFMSRLEEWGYEEDRVSISYQNARGSQEDAERISKAFVQREMDLIVALGGTAADAALQGAAGTDTRVLAGAVEQSWLEGGRLAVACASSAEEAVALALRLAPEAQTAGLLYSEGDPAAAEAAAGLSAACAARELAVAEAPVPAAGNVEELATTLCKEADLLLTPAGGLTPEQVRSAADSVAQEKKPWITGSQSLMQAGALAAVTPDYGEVGRQTADLAVALMAGKAPEALQAVVVPADMVFINQTAVSLLQLKLPEELAKTANFYSQKTP